MIRVARGPEPPALVKVRTAELAALRRIVGGGRQPLSKEIKGYGPPEVRRALWDMQHRKCCYCEKEIEDTHEDVEHYRPKAQADRAPGSALDHGYWWLSFTWANLFYSCPQCNQPPNKGIRFPLEAGCALLAEDESPPGGEKPLLLHPELDNGILHIQFVREKRGAKLRWVPTARDNSPHGDWTIRICGLDRDALLGRYDDHVKRYVMPVVDNVCDALKSESAQKVYYEVERGKRKLLDPRQCFVGLSYDALRVFVPDAQLAPWRQSWSLPG